MTLALQTMLTEKALTLLSNHKLQVKFWIPRGHNFQMQVWGPDTPDI
jgi:hypothetical protein